MMGKGLMMKRLRSGFTLIELLIVVAIIGILAAIAVPNFLNAQVRAKVARVKSDIRAIAQAQEMYYLDNNSYPPESEDNIFSGRRARSEAGLFFLTSPVSYIGSIPHDPFQDTTHIRFSGAEAAYETGVASRKGINIAFCIFLSRTGYERKWFIFSTTLLRRSAQWRAGKYLSSDKWLTE
jgi:type II secretion system protein G